MPRRKNARQCATPKCKLAPSLYPHCARCREKACNGKHINTHYNSNLAVVCDDCGATVKDATKRKGKNMVGKGNKAPWQAHPNGLKAPAMGGGNYA